MPRFFVERGQRVYVLLCHKEESLDSGTDVLERGSKHSQEFDGAGLPRNEGPSAHTRYSRHTPRKPPGFFVVLCMHGVREQDEIDNSGRDGG